MKTHLLLSRALTMQGFVLALLLTLWGSQVSAQYDLLYENHEQDFRQPWAIADDGLKNSYLAGNFGVSLTLGSITLTSTGNTGFIGKFNSSSNTWHWAKKITLVSNGSGQQTWINFAEVFDVVIDHAGNAYITGGYSGVVSFDNITLSSTKMGKKHTPDIFVAKYNTKGEVVWAKSFGSRAGFDRAKTIALDGSNNVFIGGIFTNKAVTCNGQTVDKYDVYLAKLSNAGTALWQKRYASSSLVCPYNNFGESLSTDASGNVFLAGKFAGTLKFGNGSGLTISSVNESVDVFTAKINGSGVTQWVKAAGGSSNDYGETIHADASGNVYTGGRFGTDAFLNKYNSTGDIQWSVNPFPISTEWPVTSIDRILTHSGSILVNDPFVGFKTISPSDGSVVSSDSLGGNIFGGGADIWDVAVAGSGYIFNVMVKCGTVTIGSTPLVASNDCPYNGRDIFIVRTGSEGAPFAIQTIEDVTNPFASAQEGEERDIDIYPNPANDQLHISLPDTDKVYTLYIQDQLGHTVWSEKFEPQRRTATINLDGQNFQSGIYYLTCLSNGEVETTQFVIEK